MARKLGATAENEVAGMMNMNAKLFSKKNVKTAFSKAVAILMTIVLVFWQTPVYAYANDSSPESANPATELTTSEPQAQEPVAEGQQAEEPGAVEQPDEDPDAVEQPDEESADSSASAAAADEDGSESSASKGSADKKDEKKRNTKKKFVYEDSSVKVTATLSKPEVLPEGVVFQVTPVTQYSRDYNYGAYMQALNNSAVEGVEYTNDNTMLYDMAFIARSDDGKLVEVQPENGTVNVNVSFKQQQLSEGIGAEESAEVEVTHLPLKENAKADTTAKSTNVAASDVVVEGVNANVSVEGETASFVARDFSVYAFSYTVDFTYDGYTYSFPGQGSYALADVFAALGIQDEIDSASLELIDGIAIEGDLYLTQPNGVWYINSDVPFTSTYELSVKCGNATYVINVTDAQESDDLTDFLANVVITGATQNADGEYVVETGTSYSFILSFAESSSHQFDNDSTLTYQIPAGIKIIEEQSGPLKINIVYKGRTYQVDASYVLTTGGLLSVTFDQTDPDFPRLEESTNVSFRYTYHAQFDGTEDKIHFSRDIERDIVFDEPEPGQAYAEKTATYDEETGTFHYTITVTATGDVQDVRVKDTVLGDALIVDSSSIIISGNSSTPTGGPTADGFEYVFPSMEANEVITIKYDASVDFSKGKDGKITADQTKNSVSVEPEDGPPHNSEYSHEITYKYTIKSDGTEVGTTDSGDKILQWTIDYNSLALAPAGKDVIRDTIAAGSREYMTYDGDYGIEVKVRDRNGNTVRTDRLSYDQLTQHNAYSWAYTIPEEDTNPYSYHITYQTIVDMEKVERGHVSVNLDNDGNGDHGGASVSPSELISVKKNVESYTTEEVTWVSTLSVPKDGLDQATVIDTLPSRIANGSLRIDTYKDGSLDIQGLLSGESYDVETSTSQVKVTFYYTDDSGRHTGLKESPNGRTITVRLTTKVDQQWLQAGYEPGNEYLQNHINTINFNGIESSAIVTFGKPGIQKTVDRQSDGSFLYTILLSGDTFDPPISITDTFDTSLLEIDTSKASLDDHMRIAGGTQWSQVAGKIPVAYSETNTGILITANTLPLDENGKYYPYYKISYYLKLKDGVDLEQLAIANGGEYNLVNTAIWAGHEGDCTYKVVYDFLDKELLNDGQIGGTDRTAQYMITFNSAKATLNGGEPMEMKDVLSSNLSINYGSISITTDPAGIEVPYSISGGKDEAGVPDGTTVATYTVPDSTKVVITYTAEVRGNGNQKIVNKVTVNGDEETEEHTQDFGDADEGEGAIASFKIVKVDGYNANKKLSGVKFKIFADNPDLYFDENNTLKEIELETDENGEIVLDGEDYDFYFNELYWVHEVEAPEDYGNIGFDYQVTLTNDMSAVNYGHYIYYFSDSMQIKNWPLEGLVVEKEVDSDDPVDKDRYYTFRVSILNADGTVNTDYNEKNGDDQFENGVVEFQIKDTEQKMFWGFAKGTKYKVEEIGADGFATTVTYSIFDEEGNVTEEKIESGTEHSGELTQENEVIVFKNSKSSKGSLKIKKNVIVNGAATTGTLADGTYEFTIEGPDGYESTQKITITNGVSNEVQVDNLVPGNYTVSEDTSKNPAGVSLVGDESVSVTVTANNAADVPTAEFTNEYAAEGEAVLKAKKAANPNLGERTFTFELLDADGGLIETSDPVGQGETATFTAIKYELDDLGGASSKEFTYQIKEVLPEGATAENDYTVDGVKYDARVVTTVVTVTNAGDGTLTVAYDGNEEFTTPEFENDLVMGSLKIKKNVTVNGQSTTGTLADGNYTFYVKDASGATVATEVLTIVNGASDEVQVNDLVPGAYTVTEDTSKNPEGMSLVGDNGVEVKVTANNTAEVPAVEFTNNKDLGSLEITKNVTVDGKAVTDANKTVADGTYYFDVYAYDADKTDGKGEKVADAEIEVTNGAAGKATVSDLEPGDYIVTERPTDNGTTLTGDNDKQVTVTAGETAEVATVEFTNNKDTVNIPFKKLFYGTGTASTFVFKLTSLGEAGASMWASDTGIVLPSDAMPAGDPMQDDGKVVAYMVKSVTVEPGTKFDGWFGVAQYTADGDGDYYYAIQEAAGNDRGIVYDKTCYLAHVKIADNKVVGDIEYRMLYPSGEGTYDYIGTASVPEFYNNEGKNAFATMRFRSALISPQNVKVGQVSVYPEIQKTVNDEAAGEDGATTAMVAGEFVFELREGNDGNGELIATASNDENGRVAFFDEAKAEDIGENWGLVFVNPGTYEYTITEQKGTAFGVIYDDAQILMTVEVTQADNGELSAKVTYAKDGVVTDMPTLNNTREGMDLQVYKRSRFGAEGLVDCTYALWMHSSTGDVMLQEATSDATGLITFENVVLIPGQEYFYKEVEAPAGHTVDPYRTAYWTVYIDENGNTQTKIVEETADDGWHSKYENIDLDNQGD